MSSLLLVKATLEGIPHHASSNPCWPDPRTQLTSCLLVSRPPHPHPTQLPVKGSFRWDGGVRNSSSTGSMPFQRAVNQFSHLQTPTKPVTLWEILFPEREKGRNLSPCSCPKWEFWKDPVLTVFSWEELSLEPPSTDHVTMQNSHRLQAVIVSPLPRWWLWALPGTCVSTFQDTPLSSLSHQPILSPYCLTPWIREGSSSFTFWRTWVHPRSNSRIQDKEMAKDDMFDSSRCYLSWQCDASHWGQWSTLGHDTVLHAFRNASWVGFSLYPETLVSDSHWFFQTAL